MKAARQQIIIMAHLDTYAPMSDADTENNLGGLTLQGIDDNAMGLGVMLELAEHENIPPNMAFALSPPAVKKKETRRAESP
jgi:Zn-dependent M28 family amino/carboxypeptidase